MWGSYPFVSGWPPFESIKTHDRMADMQRLKKAEEEATKRVERARQGT